jgi:putative transposase
MEKDIFESGQYYHIYNRGNNKENILLKRRIIITF